MHARLVSQLLLGLLSMFSTQPVAAAEDKLLADGFWIVAHRGASGLLPEHTLEAYRLAIAQGANFIECDVVLTRDCQPICRHEPDISQTTDALVKFPEHLKNVTIDGIQLQGIFASDLTLAEIRTLRARQPRPYRDQSHNDLFSIPTLQEYIAVAQSNEQQPVGIYPETKHPTWHDSLNLGCMQGTNMTAVILQALLQHGYGAAMGTKEWRRKPAFIQSFEVSNLKWLHKHTSIPLLQLLDDVDHRTADSNQSYGDMMGDAGLAAVATYAAGIGPWKSSMSPADGRRPEPAATNLGFRAHQHGLLVHPYTFRDDASLLAKKWNHQPQLEYEYFLTNENIDGAFTDFPATLSGVLQQQKILPKVQRSTNVLKAMTKAAMKLAVRQSLAEI